MNESFRLLTGKRAATRCALSLTDTVPATRPSKRYETIRARLGREKDGSAAIAIHPRQGSGILSSTSWANGLALIPADAVIERGTLVDFLSFGELLS